MPIFTGKQRQLLIYCFFILLEWKNGVGAFTGSSIRPKTKLSRKNALAAPHQDQAEAKPAQSCSKKPFIHRRTILRGTVAAAAILGVHSPPVGATPSTISTRIPPTTNLQDIAIGQGVWTSLDALSNTVPKNRHQNKFTASPTFATYLTRFLIQYDPAVQKWWNQICRSYQLLPHDQRQQQLGLAFASLAKSIQQAFQTTPASSTELYSKFTHTYGNNHPDARRHIAILFALLPAPDQPLACLDAYVKHEVESVPSQPKSYALPKLNRQIPAQPRTATTLFGDDLARLLPEVFHIAKVSLPSSSSSYYYTIEPTVTLYEIGIGQEFGQTAVATAFGPMASTPLQRDRPDYTAQLYGLFGLAGATACSLTHAVVIPLDVVKTRAQTTDADELSSQGSNAPPNNMIASAISIAEREGIGALLLGAQATLAGYLWYGLSVYPSYTFSKRTLSHALSPDFGVAHANEVALVAGALAAVVASLGLAPLEAARIRAVANPAIYRPLGLAGTLRVIADENGANAVANLYAGLPSLLARQVIFGSVKFLAFERACELIFSLSPGLRDATWTTLVVSLVAGGISGVLSSVVSQPADSLLTYVAKGGTNMGLLDGARTMVREEGPQSLFRGLGSRCVWAGSIIAGQFLLYDIFRTAFGVNTENLSQVFQLQV